MIATSWATLRHRPLRWVAALLTLACVAALVTASAILLDSGLRAGVEDPRVTSFDAVVSAPLTLQPEGGDPTARVALPVTPALPESAPDIVSGTGVVGKAVPLQDEQGRVIGLGVVRGSGVTEDEFDRGLAQALENAGLDVHRGAAATEVLRADLRIARGMLRTIALSFGGFILLIGAAVSGGTLTLVMTGRRQEFATLRALGCPPARILALTGLEGALLGAIAVGIGVGPGIHLAFLFADALSARGMLPGDVAPVTGPVALLCAGCAVVNTAALSAMIAAAPVARSTPTAALAQHARPARPAGRWRLPVAGVLLALGAASACAPLMLRTDMGVAGTSSAGLVMAIGAAILSPLLLPALVRRMLPRRGSAPSRWLARQMLLADPRRLATVVTPLLIAVGFSLTMVHAQAVLAETTVEQSRRVITADAVVAMDRPATSRDLAEFAAVDGAAEVTALHSSTLFLPERLLEETELVTLQTAVLTGPALGVLDPDVIAGDLGALRGNTIALDHSLARMLRLRLGEDLTVHRADGAPVTLTLIATYRDSLALGGALVPVEALESLPLGPSTVLVGAQPETPPALLQRELEATAGVAAGRGGGELIADRARAEASAVAWVNLLGLGAIGLLLAVAIVNAMAQATAARERDLAVMHRLGIPRRQILAVHGWEALTISVLALVIGSAVAAVALAPLSVALLGRPWPAGSPLTVGALAVGVPILVGGSLLGAGAVTVRRSMSLRES